VYHSGDTWDHNQGIWPALSNTLGEKFQEFVTFITGAEFVPESDFTEAMDPKRPWIRNRSGARKSGPARVKLHATTAKAQPKPRPATAPPPTLRAKPKRKDNVLDPSSRDARIAGDILRRRIQEARAAIAAARARASMPSRPKPKRIKHPTVEGPPLRYAPKGQHQATFSIGHDRGGKGVTIHVRQEVAIVRTATNTTEPMYDISINPGSILNEQARRVTSLYDQYVFRKCVIEYQPSASASQDGMFCAAFTMDPVESFGGDEQACRSFSVREGWHNCPYYGSTADSSKLSWRMPHGTNRGPFFVSDNGGTTNADVRQTVQARFIVMQQVPPATTEPGSVMGVFVLSAIIHFYNPTLQQDFVGSCTTYSATTNEESDIANWANDDVVRHHDPNITSEGYDGAIDPRSNTEIEIVQTEVPSGPAGFYIPPGIWDYTWSIRPDGLTLTPGTDDLVIGLHWTTQEGLSWNDFKSSSPTDVAAYGVPMRVTQQFITSTTAAITSPVGKQFHIHSARLYIPQDGHTYVIQPYIVPDGSPSVIVHGSFIQFNQVFGFDFGGLNGVKFWSSVHPKYPTTEIANRKSMARQMPRKHKSNHDCVSMKTTITKPRRKLLPPLVTEEEHSETESKAPKPPPPTYSPMAAQRVRSAQAEYHDYMYSKLRDLLSLQPHPPGEHLFEPDVEVKHTTDRRSVVRAHHVMPVGQNVPLPDAVEDEKKIHVRTSAPALPTNQPPITSRPSSTGEIASVSSDDWIDPTTESRQPKRSKREEATPRK
jgi:hypothetical protein